MFWAFCGDAKRLRWPTSWASFSISSRSLAYAVLVLAPLRPAISWRSCVISAWAFLRASSFFEGSPLAFWAFSGFLRKSAIGIDLAVSSNSIDSVRLGIVGLDWVIADSSAMSVDLIFLGAFLVTASSRVVHSRSLPLFSSSARATSKVTGVV